MLTKRDKPSDERCAGGARGSWGPSRLNQARGRGPRVGGPGAARGPWSGGGYSPQGHRER
jgi:hypothetical protein